MDSNSGWIAHRVGPESVSVQSTLIFSVPDPIFSFVPFYLKGRTRGTMGLMLVAPSLDCAQAKMAYLRSIAKVVDGIPKTMKRLEIREENGETITIPIIDGKLPAGGMFSGMNVDDRKFLPFESQPTIPL